MQSWTEKRRHWGSVTRLETCWAKFRWCRLCCAKHKQNLRVPEKLGNRINHGCLGQVSIEIKKFLLCLGPRTLISEAINQNSFRPIPNSIKSTQDLIKLLAVPIDWNGRAVETQSKGPSEAIKYIIRLQKSDTAARRRGKVARKIYWRSFSLFETSICVVNAITMLFNGNPERETRKLCLFESHNELIFRTDGKFA